MITLSTLPGPVQDPEHPHRAVRLLHEHGADEFGPRRRPSAGGGRDGTDDGPHRRVPRPRPGRGPPTQPHPGRRVPLLGRPHVPRRQPAHLRQRQLSRTAAGGPGRDRLRRAASRAGAAARAGTLRGIGIACYVEGCGLGPYEGAKARLTNSGEVLVTLAAAPQGQGYETVYAQIAADAIGLDMAHIRVPPATPAGSRSARARSRPASPRPPDRPCYEAAQKLRDLIFDAAGVLLGATDVDAGVRRRPGLVLGRRVRGRCRCARSARSPTSAGTASRWSRACPPGLETSAYFAPERAAYASGTHAVVRRRRPRDRAGARSSSTSSATTAAT